MRVELLDGFPTNAELAGRYGEGTGRDLGSLPLVGSACCYKLGILVEGTHALSQDRLGFTVPEVQLGCEHSMRHA